MTIEGREEIALWEVFVFLKFVSSDVFSLVRSHRNGKWK
jgi:hypothetical protein